MKIANRMITASILLFVWRWSKSHDQLRNEVKDSLGVCRKQATFGVKFLEQLYEYLEYYEVF